MKNIILLFNALPAQQKRITWSTCCTLLRFALAPIISILLYYNYWKIGFVLFTIAALTDLLDGFLARILNEQTILGAWLDPFADKVLVISCFGTLAIHNSLPLVIPRWFVAIIAVKDILLMVGSFFFCQRNAIIAPKPTLLGKVTMATQMIFLSWILLCLCFLWVPFRLYHIFLALIFLMVVASLGQYIKWGVSILTVSS